MLGILDFEAPSNVFAFPGQEPPKRDAVTRPAQTAARGYGPITKEEVAGAPSCFSFLPFPLVFNQGDLSLYKCVRDGAVLPPEGISYVESTT